MVYIDIHTMVRIEKLTSSEGKKKISRISSEKRVIRVTIVIKIEKGNPSRNELIF